MKVYLRDAAVILMLMAAFWLGYKQPRDLELQSAAPVDFHYEVTPEAARLLVLKGVEGCRDGR